MKIEMFSYKGCDSLLQPFAVSRPEQRRATGSDGAWTGLLFNLLLWKQTGAAGGEDGRRQPSARSFPRHQRQPEQGWSRHFCSFSHV